MLRTKMVGVHVTPKEHAAIKLAATWATYPKGLIGKKFKAKGMSMSQWCRLILTQAVKEHLDVNPGQK